MILIADSGSTKTTWILLKDDFSEVDELITSGINPFHQSEEEISSILSNEFTMVVDSPLVIYFYGAGCAHPDKKEVVSRAVSSVLPVKEIYVESDLMLATRSLLGKSEGIAAILGTGSNSCYYDGENIVQNVSPLGYVLGDEGNGADLGKRLLGDLLKGILPKQIADLFYEEYNLTAAEILDGVYRQPNPNRYMASFTRFLSKYIELEILSELVKERFTSFFVRNIFQYEKYRDLPINFTGSIAWHFQGELKEVAEKLECKVGKVTRFPLEEKNYDLLIVNS